MTGMGSLWETRGDKARHAAIKVQDAKFRRAVYRAHPELAARLKPRPPHATPSGRVSAPEAEHSAKAPSPVCPVDFVGSAGMRFIASLVSAKRQIPYDVLTGPYRHKSVVAARNEAVFLMRLHTARSSTEIGRFFGRDHTTIIHSMQKHLRDFPAHRLLAEAADRQRQAHLDWMDASVRKLLATGYFTAVEIGAHLGVEQNEVVNAIARLKRERREEMARAA